MADKTGVNKLVAVKVFRGLNTEDVRSEIDRRLNRETHVWAPLTHPNVLSFLGVCRNAEILDTVIPTPTLISPFCEKGDVAAYLKVTPQANRNKLVRGVAEGLKYLHSKNVVHGDLKCHNILIGDNGAPLICDFGRSKVLERRGYTTDLQFSMRYTAPELLSDDGAVLNHRTDVYSFAMIALEILTDKLPFANIRKDTVVGITASGGARPTRTLYSPPGVVNATWELLERCWDHDPLSRPEMQVVSTGLPVS